MNLFSNFPSFNTFRASWKDGMSRPVVLPVPWPGSLIYYARAFPPDKVALLESLGGPSDVSRYSILGYVAGRVDIAPEVPLSPQDFLVARLRKMLQKLPGRYASRDPALPQVPFIGGWIGFLSYELGRTLERIPSRHAALPIPVAVFLEVPVALVLDHHRQECFLVACAEPNWSARLAYERTLELCAMFCDCLLVPPRPPGRIAVNPTIEREFSAQEYQDGVRQAKEYILGGDIFQVNLSQRFVASFEGDTMALYERLREASPSPFAARLDIGDVQILSSSPERFLRFDGTCLETRPIKGTIRRGSTVLEDNEHKDRLLSDPKERAEHMMIVDLERNDLGRLALPDSVEVLQLARLESYQQVHHLVSVIQARVKPPLDLWSLLKATFPGGSVTGAPKIRAMEIIDELERSRRGVYCGAIGYISRCGQMDFNLAIRTMTVVGGQCWIQVGGAIVVDSDPKREYLETLEKSAGMLRALGLVESLA